MMIIDFFAGMLFWFFIVAWHEAGHYVAYRMLGKNPDLKFRGLSLFIGENVIRELRNGEAGAVALAGIMMGLIPIAGAYSFLNLPLLTTELMLLLYAVSGYYDYIVISRALMNPYAMFEG